MRIKEMITYWRSSLLKHSPCQHSRKCIEISVDVWVKKKRGYTLSRSIHKTRFSILLVTKGMLVDGFGRLVSIRHFFSVCKEIWEGDGAHKSTWEGGAKVDSLDETRVCWILPVLINHSSNKKKQQSTSVGSGLLCNGLVSHPGGVPILLLQQKSQWVTRVIFAFRLCQSKGCLLRDMI